MRIIRLAHAWAGAFLSLVLMVLGLSGALLVFKNDWLAATMAGANAPAVTLPGPLSKIVETTQTSLAGQGLRSLVFAGDGIGLHKVSLEQGKTAWINGDGTNIQTHEANARAEDWLFDLHHHLLAGDTGETIAGVAGLAGVVLVITGLVITWPSLRLFQARVIPRSTKRAHMLGAHRDLGLILAPLLLFSIASGAMIIFSDQSRPLLQAIAPGPKAAKPPKVGSGNVNWPKALSVAQARFPTATIRLVIWPSEPGKPATIRLRHPEEWHTNGRTIVWIDPSTSQIAGVVDAQALGSGDRAWNALWPLHAAKLGTGLSARLYDMMMAVTGFGLALLGGYGVFAFLRGTVFGAPKKHLKLEV